jgi:DNA replication and repair protein RecF
VDTQAEFHSKINVLLGSNGSGKTNFLDSIYYMSFTKSAFQATDQLNVRHGTDHFFIKGSFLKTDREHEISIAYQSGMRKSFSEDGIEYQKLSDHIGAYPVVLIAPDDVDLVKGGGESRRKFFDAILSQIDRRYLENLIQYNQALKQRNAMLRLFSEQGKVDHDALEPYDMILHRTGNFIFDRRKAFLNEFMPFFNTFFNFLVDSADKTTLLYKSDLDKHDFLVGSKNNRQRDLVLLRTNFGIHRDDYGFQLGENDMKRFGSQGQQKSFVIALKLAQWKMIEEAKGYEPILLLDDIFDKLDNFRIARLLELMKKLGQLFISDARPDRTMEYLKRVESEVKVFEVNGGQLNIVL